MRTPILTLNSESVMPPLSLIQFENEFPQALPAPATGHLINLTYSPPHTTGDNGQTPPAVSLVNLLQPPVSLVNLSILECDARIQPRANQDGGGIAFPLQVHSL